MEKQVKGATKIKLAAPKSKYVEPIIAATRSGDAGIADIFRVLQLRLRDSTWTIVFKALIVVHLMIREGAAEVTLKYLAESPKRMAISSFTEGQTQGVSIRRYYDYLLTRVKAYRDSKQDHVRTGAGQLKRMSVDKGLLRQTEIVQDQIKALLKCDLLGGADPENEISITAFRLLTMDLLELFKVMNEGTINVLEHYFEMSKPDAERALNVYKKFGQQTDQVVQYLSVARQYELYTKLEVPKLKHAPTTLTSSLQDYINDPDFEINRRQYLAQQEAKRTGKPVAKPPPSSTTTDKASMTFTSTTSPAVSAFTAPSASKGPAPDLIDFFESIEQNQQPMAQNMAAQPFQSPNLMQQQQYTHQQMSQATGYNPFLQQQSFQQQLPPQQQLQPQALQPDFTGAGFGGYGPQPLQQSSNFGFASTLSPIPQEGVATFGQSHQGTFQQQPPPPPQPMQPQQTSTNPFRQSMMPAGQQIQQFPSSPSLNRQSTNPFAKRTNNSPGLGYPQEIATPPEPSQLQPQMTGTNPFAKSRSPPPINSISVNVTGSTNPFRQSQFVNQATGQGWQHSTQGTFAGFNMNNVDTQPIFPRPGQN